MSIKLKQLPLDSRNHVGNFFKEGPPKNEEKKRRKLTTQATVLKESAEFYGSIPTLKCLVFGVSILVLELIFVASVRKRQTRVLVKMWQSLCFTRG